MGTVVSFAVWSPEQLDRAALVALSQARAGLHRVDAVFSTYRDDSPISRLRRGEISIDDVPEQVRTVLELCAGARDLSRGWFDPWAMPGGVDQTGLVKGWAVERAIEALVSGGIAAATVNAGGDIGTIGALSPNQPWRLGIRDPFSPGRLAAVVEVTSAIATSATYERGQHLIDPHTGSTSNPVASASVVGPSLAIADALATALAVCGADGLSFVADAGYHGLVILPDREIVTTAAFPLAPDDSGT